MSRCFGLRLALWAVRMSPAVEKTLSEGTLVAVFATIVYYSELNRKRNPNGYQLNCKKQSISAIY